uniref:hypothetical protein n=1 Tax=Methylogaea oryzae TaxID=1295382 RepID=UPI001C3F1C50
MSHTKRSFIQAKFEPLRIKPEQWPEALERLEQGWDFLSAAGYGAAKPHEPRETGVDWYGRLSGAERAAFDRFWKAYGYKKGKNNAAMVWHRLGEIDAATAEIIIQAATAEKRQWGKEETRDGIARKWPQAGYPSGVGRITSRPPIPPKPRPAPPLNAPIWSTRLTASKPSSPAPNPAQAARRWKPSWRPWRPSSVADIPLHLLPASTRRWWT